MQSPRRGLRGKIASAMALRGVALVARAVVGLLFARVLGAAEVGLLFLAISIANLAALISRRGLDRLALSEISQRPDEARQISGQLLRHTARGSVLVTGIGLAGLAVVDQILDIRAAIFAWALLAILPINWSQIAAHVLRGEQRIPASLLIGAVLSPPLRFVIFILLLGATTAQQASLAFLIAWVVISLIAIAVVKPDVAHAREVRLSGSGAPSEGRALYIDALNTQIAETFSTIAMSIAGTPSDIGAFSVASRLEQAVLLPTTGTRFATAPSLVSTAEGSYDRARAIAIRTARKAMLLQVPAVIIAFVAAPWFMDLLGEGFDAGTNWLRILLIGGLTNAFTGSTTQILLVGEHRDELARTSRISVMTLVVLALVLTPFLGPLGIVISAAIARIVKEAVEWRVVAEKMGGRVDVLAEAR